MRPVLSALALIVCTSGCSSDYSLSETPAPQPSDVAPAPVEAQTPRVVPQAPVVEHRVSFERVDVSEGPSSAVFAREDRVNGVREETYAAGGGAASAVVDYLFVIDNSVSMDKVLENVRAGMSSLAAEGAFPTKARVAVMTTIPADPEDLDKPHPTASLTPGLARDPGFMGLVDGERIGEYRQVAPPAVAERFPLDGCSAWFEPSQKNESGEPCLLAHTQIGLTAVGVEAGLIAVRQLIENAPEPVFRPGAAVNVVFVSDTHDPGIPLDAPGGEDLRELRPDFATLAELVFANSLVSSFRAHAIAPARPCVEKWPDGPTYREVSRDSGGVFLDVCTTTDYRPLIEQIARRGAVVQRPVFPLGRAARDVEAVLVDRSPVSFSVSGDGKVLVLDDELPRRRSRVHVRYTYDR